MHFSGPGAITTMAHAQKDGARPMSTHHLTSGAFYRRVLSLRRKNDFMNSVSAVHFESRVHSANLSRHFFVINPSLRSECLMEDEIRILSIL
jgi:hypothetical protein